jgi:hypothetical protein
VAPAEELDRIAGEARRYADADEELVGILPAEPAAGELVFLCAYERRGAEGRAWLALDPDGEPVAERGVVREAVSIAALCELADDSAGGGGLEELRAQLVTLRLTENPPGIEEAEDAALALERVLGGPGRIASPAYLDRVGSATLRLEQALGGEGGSPFAAALRAGTDAVQALTAEVEATYKRELR